MLHQWWLSDGKSLTKTGFNSLCFLLNKTVTKCTEPMEWPTSVYEVEKFINIPYVSNI